ncbi:MAG: undecaprenyl-diphosphate phosphatase [Chitinophagaceae bacterium]
MSIFEAIILAIIEGITEFLPVSSTGHMVLASSYFGIQEDDFVKLFEIVIQLGAILAVIYYYYKKFFTATKLQFYYKLIVAVIPALILGALFDKKIDILLEHPLVIGTMLFIGGVFLLFMDKLFLNPTITQEENLTYKQGFIIGLWQCLAMIPGVSRSAASIIGGMQQKLTRHLAVEFSFFLAVPTMCAATGYKLLQAMKNNPKMLTNPDNLVLLGIGNLVAFLVALLAIKFFITYVQKYGFKIFGYYRIVLGILVFVYFYFLK